MIKPEEEGNIFARYNKEFLKSGVRKTEVLYEIFHCQK